jgi:Cysteine-rich secretory protein family
LHSLVKKVGLMLVCGFIFSESCAAQDRISETERQLLDSANRERAARALAPLKWDEKLARAARKHAELMAEQHLLLHQLPGEPDLAARARDAGAGFSRVTENIGMAEYAGAFHNGWMHSPGHRANILDAAVDAVGIAVVEGGEQLFAVEDFARLVTLLSVEEQEQHVGKLIAARGLRLLRTNDEARQSCASGRDYFGRGKPRYIAHYETVDISQLPEGLDKELRSGRYKTAAVGACQRRESADAAPFRMVVLLY